MPTAERLAAALVALGEHRANQGRGSDPVDLTSVEARADLIALGFPDIEEVL